VIVTCWRMEWCYVSTSLPESLGEGAVYDLVVASVAITNGLMHDWAADQCCGPGWACDRRGDCDCL
jgi:hypothetical protein